jgi:hypothetical protein
MSAPSVANPDRKEKITTEKERERAIPSIFLSSLSVVCADVSAQ